MVLFKNLNTNQSLSSHKNSEINQISQIKSKNLSVYNKALDKAISNVIYDLEHKNKYYNINSYS